MNVLPPLDEMVQPSEMTLTLDEEIRLFSSYPRKGRWWAAPLGTPFPEGEPDATWVQLNEPGMDDMAGALILDARSGGGLLSLVYPTDRASAMWRRAYASAIPLRLFVDHPDLPERGTFRQVNALPMAKAEARSVRFAVIR